MQTIENLFINDIWDEVSRIIPMMNELNKKSKKTVMNYIGEVAKEYMAQRSSGRAHKKGN